MQRFCSYTPHMCKRSRTILWLILYVRIHHVCAWRRELTRLRKHCVQAGKTYRWNACKFLLLLLLLSSLFSVLSSFLIIIVMCRRARRTGGSWSKQLPWSGCTSPLTSRAAWWASTAEMQTSSTRSPDSLTTLCLQLLTGQACLSLALAAYQVCLHERLS